MVRENPSSMGSRRGISRRYFLQVTAAGAVTATALGVRASSGRARAAAYDKFTWISPRGTLEVLDDYGYWSAKKMGYFGDLNTVMQPGPSDGTATVKFVDVGQADMGFPSPGVFSFAIQNGMNLISVFNEGARDTFSFAFRKGEGSKDLKSLEGKTDPPRLGGLAGDHRSDAGVAGRRHHQGQVCRGRLADLGNGAEGRAGRRGAVVGRPARRVDRQGPRLRVLARRARSRISRPTPSSSARTDFEDPDKQGLHRASYLRGWAMGLEFGYTTRAPRWRSSSSSSRRSPAISGPRSAPPRSCSRSTSSAATWKARRLGLARHEELAVLLRHDLANRPDHEAGEGRGRLTNDLIKGANDFDKGKVKADAEGYKLPKRHGRRSMSTKIKAHLYDQAV